MLHRLGLCRAGGGPRVDLAAGPARLEHHRAVLRDCVRRRSPGRARPRRRRFRRLAAPQEASDISRPGEPGDHRWALDLVWDRDLRAARCRTGNSFSRVSNSAASRLSLT